MSRYGSREITASDVGTALASSAMEASIKLLGNACTAVETGSERAGIVLEELGTSGWLSGAGEEALEPPENAQDSLCEDLRLIFRNPSASLCLRLRNSVRLGMLEFKLAASEWDTSRGFKVAAIRG